MKKLSEELKNGRVAKLRDGRIVLVIRENEFSECKLINKDTYLYGANYSENGSYTIDRYCDESKNDIAVKYLEIKRVREKELGIDSSGGQG